MPIVTLLCLSLIVLFVTCAIFAHMAAEHIGDALDSSSYRKGYWAKDIIYTSYICISIYLAICVIKQINLILQV